MNILDSKLESQEVQLPHGYSRRQIAIAVSPQIQEFILFPTEKCNFRCTYCYEDFEIGKMSKKLQVAIERLLDNRVNGLKRLSFSWFGGEPLLAKDVVLRLSEYAHKLCTDHGVHFHGGLTTNAYLLDKNLAKDLIKWNQNFYQITLDGLGEAHDQLRRRADGKGTFDVIWQNLLGLKELDGHFECVLRLHVRRENIQNLEELMIEIANEFGNDPRFRVDFQHLRDMGGDGGKTINKPITLSEMPEIEQNLRTILSNRLLELNIQSGKAEQNEFAGIKIAAPTSNSAGESAGSQRGGDVIVGEPYICYAGKPNSLIIRANGRIGKCTVALSDARNDLGFLDDNGQIVLSQEKLKPWIRGIETLEPKVTGCPIVGLPTLDISSPTKERNKIIPISTTK